MRKVLFHSFIFLILFPGFSCRKMEDASKPGTSFYHWKTELKLSPIERAYLDSLEVDQLYVKFFDVDWETESQSPSPHAVVQINTDLLFGLDIFPVIFITNRTFLNMPENELEPFAGRVVDKIFQLYTPIHDMDDAAPKIIQFDCDWTGQTQEKFFSFLNLIRDRIDLEFVQSQNQKPLLSATIRLHQFKYPEKTGIPPVDMGMLMFYNTGALEDWNTENSILELETAARYLPKTKSLARRKPYPLPLDLALPLFRWGVIYRHGELWKLINNLEGNQLLDKNRFHKLSEEETPRFVVSKSTFLQGHYLIKGDEIRLESVSEELLLNVLALLKERFSNFTTFGTANPRRKMTISFYHLDKVLLKSFPHESLKRVLDAL